MLLKPELETRVLRYLLGELSADERADLERRYFDEDELFEQVQAIEQQLIRDYLAGTLPNDQQRLFEARYLSDAQLRHKVEDATALRDVLRSCVAAQPKADPITPFSAPATHPAMPEPGAVGIAALAPDGSAPPEPADGPAQFQQLFGSVTSSPRPVLSTRDAMQSQPKTARSRGRFAAMRFRPALNWAAFGAAAAAIAIAIWMGIDNGKLRNDISRLNRELAARAAPTGALATFLLSPGTLKGSDQRQRVLSLSSNVNRVELVLQFPQAVRYSRYRVVITTVDGREVASTDAVVTAPNRVAAEVPAANLRADDYVVSLEGFKSDGQSFRLESYSFRLALP